MTRGQRGWLFYSLLGMFIIIFIVTILALVGQIKLVDGYLKVLFSAVIIEIVGIATAWFKRKDIFSETFDRNLANYKPNSDAQKVLATFWKYQLSQFTENPATGRWAARLPQDRQQIPNFYRGIAELVDVGLLDIDQANNHAFLSIEGFSYCHKRNQELTQADSYQYI